jgi:hypothetical protein
MLNVIMLSVVILSGIVLNVVMLSVEAANRMLTCFRLKRKLYAFGQKKTMSYVILFLIFILISLKKEIRQRMNKQIVYLYFGQMVDGGW